MPKKRRRERVQREESPPSLFAIDTTNLLEEWNNHPEEYRNWSEKLADAKLVYDEAKALLEVVSCEISRDIRSDPDSFGLEKVTEEAVKKAIPLDDQYQDAQQIMFQAKHRVDVLTGYCAALQDRRRALESTVELHGQQYWAAPRSNDKGIAEAEKRAARTSRRKK